MIKIPVFITLDDDLYSCMEFARDAHEGQVRKYTNEPYIVHPIEVATIVNTVATTAGFAAERTKALVMGALLHDVIEDTEATYNEVEKQFGTQVRDLVFWCTDVTNKSQGNRRIRKELELTRLCYAPGDAKFIKLADFISNTQSIVEHDPNFAKTYLSEKSAILAAFREMNRAENLDLKVNDAMLKLAFTSLTAVKDTISE